MGRTAFVDLQETEVSLYVFENRGKALFQDARAFPLSEGAAFSVNGLPSDIHESYLSLPIRMLNFRIITLPFTDIKKVREVVPLEIDGLILGGTETVVFDARIIRQERGQSEVLVSYVAKQVMRTLLQSCREAGLDPRAVTSLELGDLLSSFGGVITPDILLSSPVLSEEKRRAAALFEMKSPSVNLRTGEFAYTADSEKSARGLRTSAVLLMLILLLLFSFASLKVLVLKKDNRRISEEMRKTYTSLFPGDKKVVDELLQLKSHMKELEEKEEAFVGIAPLEVLLMLAQVQKQGVALSEVSIDRELIVLKGECPSLSDVQVLKKDLEEAFIDVTISDTKPSLQNRTLFTVTAKGRKA